MLPTDERLGLIDGLDLEPVVFRLTHPDPGDCSLDLAEADSDIALYRCFLKLCTLYPGAMLVPTRQIDRVWHAHILDTAKYRADCERALGRFVDHFPYLGLRGDRDRRQWRADFARTRQLFAEHFGVNLGEEPAASACGNHGDGSDCCVGCVRPGTGDARPRPDRAGAGSR